MIFHGSPPYSDSVALTKNPANKRSTEYYWQYRRSVNDEGEWRRYDSNDGKFSFKLVGWYLGVMW